MDERTGFGWGTVLLAAACTLAGLAAGAQLFSGHAHGPEADGSTKGDEAADEPALSAATLRTLGVRWGVVQPTTWTDAVGVAAVVESPPAAHRAVRAPLGGRVVELHVELGEPVPPGRAVATVLRDPLPRPELTLTGEILKPASELHETVLELRARVQELEIARTELERVERFTARVEDEDLPVIPLQRRIDLQYRVARAEAAVEQSRMEMEKHGLDEQQIVSLEGGEHLPPASGAMWRRALEHNGVWTQGAQALYESIPNDLHDTPWVVASIGELAVTGLATPALADWFASDPRAGARFLDVATLLQRGHSLEDVQRLHALGALEPSMRITAPEAPTPGGAWDVRDVLVQAGARVAVGDPLVELHDPGRMLLRLEPVGSEIAAVLHAKERGAELSATTLIPGAGPKLDGLRVDFVGEDSSGSGTLAYVTVWNVLLPSDDDRRTWGLRRGTRYTVRVPRRAVEDVFVLPAEAVAEVGRDLVVFHRHSGDQVVPIPLAVMHRDEEVVVVERVEGLDLFPGDEVALSGAFALSLALQTGGGGSDGDHGHSH